MDTAVEEHPLYDPTDPMGKMFFNILATFAEFEVDLLRMRTREGMAIAKAKGNLKGKPPKLSVRQQAHVLRLHQDGEHSIADLAELLAGVGRRRDRGTAKRDAWLVAGAHVGPMVGVLRDLPVRPSSCRLYSHQKLTLDGERGLEVRLNGPKLAFALP